MTTPNVFVKVGTTMAKVHPDRRVLVKYQLEQASKIKSVKVFRSSVMRKTDKRDYPRFIEGGSTADYVERYWSLNAARFGAVTEYNPRLKHSVLKAGEAARIVADLYEPLGTSPQYTPIFDGVEEPLV